MSEHIAKNKHFAELPPKGGLVRLHNQVAELSHRKPWMDRDAALKTHLVNGDIVAMLELPSEKDDRKGMKIALVDFGEDYADGYLMHDNADGEPLRGLGMPESRFGLYTVAEGDRWEERQGDGPLVKYYPIHDEALTIGRDNSEQVNGRLGIVPYFHVDMPADYPGTGAISRRHATFSVRGDLVTIEDHSSHGTRVQIGAEKNHGSMQVDAAAVQQLGRLPFTRR